ncbi:MAG: hypothetical protein ACRDTM_09765 [Micromonosporaceae bacterium]
MAQSSKRKSAPSKSSAGAGKPAASKSAAGSGKSTASKSKTAPAGRKPSAEATRPSASEPTAPPLPGATVLWVLLAAVVVWFAGQLWALRGTLRSAVDGVQLGAEAITPLITFGLPTVISPAVVVGATTCLVAGILLADRLKDTRWVRLALAAGLLAAAVTGGAVYASGYGTAATVGVAVAAFVGALASAVPARVLAAGVAGALTVAVTQFVVALFTSPLRGLLDGSGTGPEIADAGVTLARITGVVAGVLAGIVAYAVLRRHRPAGLGAHALAGAAAGLFLLVAEVITRFTLAAVVSEAGGMVRDEVWLLQRIGEARLNGALVVLFAGTISCLIALGRSLPSKPPKQYKPRQAPTGTTRRTEPQPKKRAEEQTEQPVKPPAEKPAPSQPED